MKWKIKGVLVIIATVAILQSCSKSSCKGGMCPVFSEVKTNCPHDYEVNKIIVGVSSKA